MTPFSTYEYYKTQYYGKLSEDDYNANVLKACSKIISNINGSVPEIMLDNVALCECELTDIIFDFAKIPMGVYSVNNDGYSVTYGGNSNNRTNSEQSICKAVCAKYLQSPINLMCRWV